MNWKVPLADLDFGQEEERAVTEVLRNKWLTMGAVTQQFEGEFAAFAGAPHAVAVSNATVGLHLACLALGIGPDDEVIVPSLTFVATANAVLYTGAEVRFADILGPEELNISPESIASHITSRTKAVIVVHYGGYPCRMLEILSVARGHNLAVIEDAAHAPGAFLKGAHLGTWGDIGCFSFFSNKNLSTGEGGMLVTARADLVEKLRLLRSHGMTSLTWDRHQGHAYTYDVVDLGYNYRIDEIRSALGRVQLAKLESNNAPRGEITRRYWELLSGSGFTLPFSTLRSRGAPRDYLPSYHLMPVLLPGDAGRQAFMEGMRAAGIQTSIHYTPIHRFTFFQGRYGSQYPMGALPKTEDVASRQVTLPLYPGMTDLQVQLVAETAISQLRVSSHGSPLHESTG
jgi:dTDP-4-amino-4,6-dideoxygalactose transaminase